MEELRGMESLDGWTIIEHRHGNENIVGKIELSGLNGDGSFGVAWHHHDGCHRTTLFFPVSWQCEIVADVIFLIRLAEDGRVFDIPWREADLYTIVQAVGR